MGFVCRCEDWLFVAVTDSESVWLSLYRTLNEWSDAPGQTTAAGHVHMKCVHTSEKTMSFVKTQPVWKVSLFTVEQAWTIHQPGGASVSCWSVMEKLLTRSVALASVDQTSWKLQKKFLNLDSDEFCFFSCSCQVRENTCISSSLSLNAWTPPAPQTPTFTSPPHTHTRACECPDQTLQSPSWPDNSGNCITVLCSGNVFQEFHVHWPLRAIPPTRRSFHSEFKHVQLSLSTLLWAYWIFTTCEYANVGFQIMGRAPHQGGCLGTVGGQRIFMLHMVPLGGVNM